MAAVTSIEWTDKTWNPVRGCSRVSEGCRNCYAERIAARFSGPGAPFEGLATIGKNGARWTGKLLLVPGVLNEPMRWRKPARVFVNSMSDLFHESLRDEDIAAVFGVMEMCSRHTFQVLTKRPERMRAWVSEWKQRIDYMRDSHDARGFDQRYAHVWLGVSVEDQPTADERIPLLLETPATVRFVSYEPALGPVDFKRVQWPGKHRVDVLRGGTWDMPPFPGFMQHSDMRTLDWIIVGGESGPGARPFDLAWARSVVKQCRDAGVACFVKQLGGLAVDGLGTKPLKLTLKFLRSRKGGDPAEWPEELRVREFPRSVSHEEVTPNGIR